MRSSGWNARTGNCSCKSAARRSGCRFTCTRAAAGGGRNPRLDEEAPTAHGELAADYCRIGTHAHEIRGSGATKRRQRCQVSDRLQQ